MGHVVPDHTTRRSQLLDDLRLVSASKDRYSGTVLGDVARQLAGHSVADDQVHGQVLRGLGRLGSQAF